MHSDRITAGEIATVCSRFDLGVVEEVRRFRGGSRSAPKVLLISRHSERSSKRVAFMLKRRAPGQADPERVALCHRIILHLSEHGFPTPRLVGTRGDNNSMLQENGHVYEVFQFVPGFPYDRKPPSTRSAGRVLATCHRLLSGFRSPWEPPRATFHSVRGAVERIAEIPAKVGNRAIAGLTSELSGLYLEAAHEAERAHLKQRPLQFIHADWHPGNMVFRPAPPPTPSAEGAAAFGGERAASEGLVVAAVLDFDSARLGLPLLDWANGALQFSMARTGADPERWPEEIDLVRYQSFVRGYYGIEDDRARSGGGTAQNTNGDMEAIPWLMIEALIVEAAAPIAATGRFGKLEAEPILRAVHRTSSWIRRSAPRLVSVARQAASRG